MSVKPLQTALQISQELILCLLNLANNQFFILLSLGTLLLVFVTSNNDNFNKVVAEKPLDKHGVSWHAVKSVLTRYEETVQVEFKGRRGRRRKLPTADEQYLKVVSLRKREKSSKDLTKNLRDASSPLDEPSTVCHIRNILS